MKVSTALALAGVLVLGVACSPPAAQTLSAASPPSPGLPTETAESTAPSTEAALVAVQELLTHSVRSSTGVLLELPQVKHGTSCVRLAVAASGIRAPSGAPPDYRPPAPLVDVKLFYGGEELALQPRGGGGGGGQSADGSFGIGQETVYETDASLPDGGSLPMIAELTLDDSLGFTSPMRFAVQAEPDESPSCGF